MMGFSSQQYHREEVQRKWRINPVWRGIGCALILIIPIMSWYGAMLFLQTNKEINLPWDMTKPLTIRYSRIAEIDRVILSINRFTADNNIEVGQLFFTGLFLVIGFGLLSFFYAMAYRVAGPPRYGPLDVPPDMMRK